MLQAALGKLIDLANPLATERRYPKPLAETWQELISTQAALSAEVAALAAEVAAQAANWNEDGNRTRRGTMPPFMRRA